MSQLTPKNPTSGQGLFAFVLPQHIYNIILWVVERK